VAVGIGATGDHPMSGGVMVDDDAKGAVDVVVRIGAVRKSQYRERCDEHHRDTSRLRPNPSQHRGSP
jgi:hypothetical protein